MYGKLPYRNEISNAHQVLRSENNEHLNIQTWMQHDFSTSKQARAKTQKRD